MRLFYFHLFHFLLVDQLNLDSKMLEHNTTESKGLSIDIENLLTLPTLSKLQRLYLSYSDI